MTARRMVGAAVVVLPLLYFLFLLIVSPAAAGGFAGSFVGRLADPLMLLNVILSAIVGAAARSFVWPVAFAIVATGINVTINYRWWVAIAGSEFAEQTAYQTAEWAFAFATCSYLVGRAFSRPSTAKSSTSMDMDGPEASAP